MNKVVKRGFVDTDEKEFSDDAVPKLMKAAKDLYYLLNQGYKVKGASVFVGNHYLLTERQRLAIVRAVSPRESIENRNVKEVKNSLENKIINIDGFNTIITLEVALSDSLLLRCMDGTIRDLASLRGTYRIIDKTEEALKLMRSFFEEKKIKKAVFYLDAPVSNSGRLKQKILEVLEGASYEVEVNNINNVDSVLETLDNVVTSDAIILDKCISWINLNSFLINENMMKNSYVDFR